MAKPESESSSEQTPSQTSRSSRNIMIGAFIIILVAVAGLWFWHTHHHVKVASAPVANDSNTWRKLLNQDKCTYNSAGIPPTIQQGSTGGCVQLAQFLIWGAQLKYGQTPIKDDGKFGADTKTAVASFQSNSGLTPNGVIDEATWRKLNGCFNGAATTPTQIWTCPKL